MPDPSSSSSDPHELRSLMATRSLCDNRDLREEAFDLPDARCGCGC